MNCRKHLWGVLTFLVIVNVFAYAQDRGRYNFGNTYPWLEVMGTTDEVFATHYAGGNTQIYLWTYSSNKNHKTNINFVSSESATRGVGAETTDGGNLGQFVFFGHNSGDTKGAAANIRVKQNGASGASQVPGQMFLETYTSSALNSNQLVLDTTGFVGVGVAVPRSKLTVASGALSLETGTFADTDETPSVSGGNIFLTVSNTGSTAIADLDDPQVGQTITIICNNATNAPTIADSSPFFLAGAWGPGINDSITLYVRADDDYVEISRSDN